MLYVPGAWRASHSRVAVIRTSRPLPASFSAISSRFWAGETGLSLGADAAAGAGGVAGAAGNAVGGTTAEGAAAFGAGVNGAAATGFGAGTSWGLAEAPAAGPDSGEMVGTLAGAGTMVFTISLSGYGLTSEAGCRFVSARDSMLRS